MAGRFLFSARSNAMHLHQIQLFNARNGNLCEFVVVLQMSALNRCLLLSLLHVRYIWFVTGMLEISLRAVECELCFCGNNEVRVS